MVRSDNASFDYDFYINKNRETAIALYGDRLDENRNIVGTNFYFDSYWRLRERRDSNE